jgi:hypothetical protein
MAISSSDGCAIYYMKRLFPLIALTAATFSSNGQSSLNGDTATLVWGEDISLSSLPSLMPSPQTVYGPATIGSATPTFSGLVDFNVSGNTVTIADPPTPGLIAVAFAPESSDGFAFNGFVFTDLTEPLAGATLSSSTVSGFTTSDFGIAGGDLWVNFAGLVIENTDQIQITLQAAQEPSTWVLLLMGCTAVPLIRRPRGGRGVPRHCSISTS